MLWQRAAQLPPPRPAFSTVPEGESVRLSALKAAWARDKWVARRRIWWRWTIWSLQRHVLPSLAVLGIGFGLWFGAKAALGRMDTPSTPESALQAAPAPLTQRQAAEATALGLNEASMQPTASTAWASPYRTGHLNGMDMKFERLISDTKPSAQAHQTPVSSAATPAAAKIPNPQLISENWLHSKEP